MPLRPKHCTAAILLIVGLVTFSCTVSIAAAPQAVSRATLDRLAHQLTANDVQVRIAALKQLALYGPAAARTVPAIVDVLNENRAAANAFSYGKPVSPVVTESALLALKKIGRAAHDAAPYVTPLLKDRNELFRRTQVLEALTSIGPSSDSTGVLMRVVNEEGKFTYTRALAITLLGRIEPPAVEATDLLRDLSEDVTDKRSRSEAMRALDSILRRASTTGSTQASSDDQLLRTLRMQIDSEKEIEMRIAALEQIAKLGSKAVPLVPTLMNTMCDPDRTVSHAALEAIGSMHQSALIAVPSLVAKFLSERDQNERIFIARTISKLDPEGKRTLPLLQEPLEDPFQSRLAIEILQELGTDETTTIAQKARQRWKIK